MMKLSLRVALAAALAAGASTVAVSSAWADTTVKFRVMETTDIHTNVLNYDYYKDKDDDTFGLSRTATLIRQARKEVPNSILVDNGDLIQGNPLGDYMAKQKGLKKGDVHPVYKAMNLLGYDVGNLGNHEFNYGLEFLDLAVAGAKFPYVNANVYTADGSKNLYSPYVILDRKLKDEAGKEHPIKIGVIGFVPPQIMQWDKANLEGKVQAKDIVDSAMKFVPEMKQKGADIVIAVPHSGMATVARQGMEENAAYYLTQVKGIDAIMFGHAHLVFPSAAFKDLPGADIEKGTVNGIPATMPGFWGSHLGLVDFTLSVDDKGKWSIVDKKAEVRGIFKTENNKKVPVVENDPEIVAAVQAEHQGTLDYVRKAVGKTTAPIFSYFALVQDDPSIQIVNDAQTWYVKRLLQGTEYGDLPVLSAGAPFKAGGRGGAEYYTNVEAGDIAIKNIADLYLYPNTVRAVLVTGETVREWLEMSAGQFKQIDPAKAEPQELVEGAFPTFNFDVLDGVTYKIDVSQPARYDKDGKVVNASARRIVDLMYQGKPIDPGQKFVVATNNYRAGGGGKFPGLDGKNIILEAPDENRTALIEYIQQKKEVNPSADNNWSLTAGGKPVTVVFDSSPAAEKYLASNAKLSKIGAGENGFTKYGLKVE